MRAILDRQLSMLIADDQRPSISPGPACSGRLLLQACETLRSEQQLIEQLPQSNLLFRFTVGYRINGVQDPGPGPTVGTRPEPATSC